MIETTTPDETGSSDDLCTGLKRQQVLKAKASRERELFKKRLKASLHHDLGRKLDAQESRILQGALSRKVAQFVEA